MRLPCEAVYTSTSLFLVSCAMLGYTHRVQQRAYQAQHDLSTTLGSKICQRLDVACGDEVCRLKSAKAIGHVTLAIPNEHTRSDIHGAAGQCEQQPNDLHSIPLMLFCHAQTLFAPNAALPDGICDLQIWPALTIQLLRQREVWEEEVVDQKVDQLLSQRRANLFIFFCEFLLRTEPIEELTLTVVLLIPYPCRLPRLPEKLLFPCCKVVGFVDVG